VEFAGHTADIEQFYKKAACYVMSSRYEGFPMVLLEAQSYGLPVISFDCKTGPRELIDDERNGYLVEDGDVEKLAEAMVKFTKDKNRAEKMSVYASERVKRYSIDAVISQWKDMLEKVI
jgi:glycosyltransferase involved in cell wall biosynthesis